MALIFLNIQKRDYFFQFLSAYLILDKVQFSDSLLKGIF